MSLSGSCHCGKVSYTADIDPVEAIQCNCSICRRKGYLLAFAGTDSFSFNGSRDDLIVYTFHTGNIRHQFCKACGCAPFGEGTGPDGKAMVAINLRCADGIDIDALKVIHYDGASV